MLFCLESLVFSLCRLCVSIFYHIFKQRLLDCSSGFVFELLQNGEIPFGFFTMLLNFLVELVGMKNYYLSSPVSA